MKRHNVYDYHELAKMSLDHVKTALNWRNGVTGEKAFYSNIYGESYLVMIDSSMVRVWDATGATSILTKNIDGLDVGEILRMIEDRTREWSTGIVHCSDCDTSMRRFSEDIGGRFYAGTYCRSCWSSTWSERAATETYD